MAESPSFDPESGLNAALYKAIADCRDCVQKMKEDYNETGMPVTDDSTSLHRLSAKLEFLLQAHSKGRTGMIGKKKDYWDYMVRCLATRKSIHDGIRFVKACPDYKTSMGRGRALIRFCLVHNCLADTIQQCVMDGEATSAFYKPNSPLMRHEMSSDLIDTLYVLNEVRFDLNPTGHDLDVSWPTFSKMSPGNLSNWRPPSRAMSISSLDSSFSTSYENNGGLSSSLGDVDERHEPELVAYKVEVADLRTRIEELATENHALKTEKATHVCGPPPDDTVSDNAALKKLVESLQLKLTSCETLLEKTTEQNSALRKIAEVSQEMAKVRGEQLERLRSGLKPEIREVDCQTEEEEEGKEMDNLKHQVELLKRISELKSDENEALKDQMRCLQVDSLGGDEKLKQTLIEMHRQIVALKEALKLSKELLHLRTEEVESLKKTLEEFSSRVAEDKAAFEELKSALEEEGEAREVERQEYMNKMAALEEALNLTKHILAARNNERNLTSAATQTEDSVDLKKENEDLKVTVATQERRLSSVTLELSRMWMLLFNLKSQHNKLWDDEAFRRFELGEHRKYLAKLRLDLERNRSRSAYVRNLNEDSAKQFSDMRVEFRLRKAVSAEGTLNEPKEEEAPLVEVSEVGQDRLSRMEAACKDLHAHLALNANKGDELDSHLARLMKMRSTESEEESTLSSPDIVVTDASQQDGKEHHFLEQVANLRSCLEARDVEMRTLADSNSSLKEETGSLRLQLSTQVKDYERVVAASEAAQEELARLSAAVTEQEGIIGSLEAKLAEFETDRETELDKSMRFNESLQEELAEKALIAEEMEKRVERFEVAVKSLRKSVRTVCSELSSLSSPAHRKSPMINGGTDGESECLEADEGSDVEDTEGIVGLESRIKGLVVCVQKHVVEFDADNRLLREGLVRLLKEKDKLWHHNNRLVQLFRQLMRTDLAEDESAVDCSSCGALFSLMLRRHHCRLCGKYFCYACADHYLSLAATRGRTRVCRHCFGLVQKINLDGNSSFAVDDNEEEVKEEAAKQENGVPETPSDSPEHEIRRRNRGIEETAALIVTLPRPKPRRPHEAEEENFTVITSGEIASVRAEAADCPPPVLHPSKLYEPLSIADLVQRDTSSPSPLQDESEDGNPFESYPYNVEFWVTAGNSLGVPISLPIQPCVVDWKVDVQSQMDLNFAITYRPSVDVGPTESLHKIQRLVEGSSRGQLRVKRPGLYTFVFDNTYSTLKAKKVALQLKLERELSRSKSPPPGIPGTP